MNCSFLTGRFGKHILAHVRYARCYMNLLIGLFVQNPLSPQDFVPICGLGFGVQAKAELRLQWEPE